MALEECKVKHYPMTQDQRQTLDRDVATIMENLGGIVTLLRACHGDKDEQVYRAEEARAAVQRLVWALERHAQTAARGSAA
jgi:hypothetical protein